MKTEKLPELPKGLPALGRRPSLLGKNRAQRHPGLPQKGQEKTWILSFLALKCPSHLNSSNKQGKKWA